MLDSPFIYKFTTDRGFYIYDVNTNQILKASQIEYDLVDDYAILPRQKLLSKWKRKYDGVAIKNALKGITYWQERGCFSSRHPENLSYPVKEELLSNLLDSKMEQLILNITERCNMRCRYCTYSGTYSLERKHSDRTMEVTIAKKAIRLFRQHSKNSGKVHISFYGGEPLICFGRMQGIVEYIKGLDWGPEMSLHLDTNGTPFTDEIIQFLIENEFILQISLDGPKEVHDKYRVYKDGRGTFNKIVDNLQRIRAINPEYFERNVVLAQTTAPPYDLLKVSDFFCGEPYNGNLVSPNFVDAYDTSFFQKYASDVKSLFLPTYEKLKSYYISSRIGNKDPTKFAKGLLERRLVDLYRRGIRPMGESVYPNGICIPGVRRLFVSVDGKFYPCERTIGSDFVIGDVDSGVDLIRVKKLIDDYLELSTPECTHCWAVRLCKLCFSMARRGDRLDKDRKMQRCVTERDSLHSALRMYATIMEQNPLAFDFVKEMIFE